MQIDEAFGYAFGVLLLSLGGLVLLAMVHSKPVRGYYMGANNCIHVDIDWAPDTTAFCSDDIDKKLRVLKELQAK